MGKTICDFIKIAVETNAVYKKPKFKFYKPVGLDLHIDSLIMDMKDGSIWRCINITTVGNYSIYHIQTEFGDVKKRKLNLMDMLQTEEPRYVEISKSLYNRFCKLADELFN